MQLRINQTRKNFGFSSIYISEESKETNQKSGKEPLFNMDNKPIKTPYIIFSMPLKHRIFIATVEENGVKKTVFGNKAKNAAKYELRPMHQIYLDDAIVKEICCLGRVEFNNEEDHVWIIVTGERKVARAIELFKELQTRHGDYGPNLKLNKALESLKKSCEKQDKNKIRNLPKKSKPIDSYVQDVGCDLILMPFLREDKYYRKSNKKQLFLYRSYVDNRIVMLDKKNFNIEKDKYDDDDNADIIYLKKHENKIIATWFDADSVICTHEVPESESAQIIDLMGTTKVITREDNIERKEGDPSIENELFIKIATLCGCTSFDYIYVRDDNYTIWFLQDVVEGEKLDVNIERALRAQFPQSLDQQHVICKDVEICNAVLAITSNRGHTLQNQIKEVDFNLTKQVSFNHVLRLKKLQSNSLSSYLLKQNPNERSISDFEVANGFIFRILLGLCHSKVRGIYNKADGKRLGSLIELYPNYISLNNYAKHSRNKFISADLIVSSEMIKVLVASYFQEENDGHGSNIGFVEFIDPTTGVKKILCVKIDDDRAKWSIVYKYFGLDRNDLNLKPEDCFIIHVEDIDSFPILKHAKPTRWIKDYEDKLEPGWLAKVLATPSLKKKFDNDKGHMFLKIILIPDKTFDAICTASFYSETKKAVFKNSEIERMHKFTMALLQSKSFPEYVKNNPDAINKVISEFMKYNATFKKGNDILLIDMEESYKKFRIIYQDLNISIPFTLQNLDSANEKIINNLSIDIGEENVTGSHINIEIKSRDNISNSLVPFVGQVVSSSDQSQTGSKQSTLQHIRNASQIYVSSNPMDTKPTPLENELYKQAPELIKTAEQLAFTLWIMTRQGLQSFTVPVLKTCKQELFCWADQPGFQQFNLINPQQTSSFNALLLKDIVTKQGLESYLLLLGRTRQVFFPIQQRKVMKDNLLCVIHTIYCQKGTDVRFPCIALNFSQAGYINLSLYMMEMNQQIQLTVIQELSIPFQNQPHSLMQPPHAATPIVSAIQHQTPQMMTPGYGYPQNQKINIIQTATNQIQTPQMMMSQHQTPQMMTPWYGYPQNQKINIIQAENQIQTPQMMMPQHQTPQMMTPWYGYPQNQNSIQTAVRMNLLMYQPPAQNQKPPILGIKRAVGDVGDEITQPTRKQFI